MMEGTMDFRSMIPFGGGPLSRQRGASDPFANFRREFDKLVEDTLGKGPLTAWPGGEGVDLKLDVSETDKEVKVTAELPGVDPKEVELTLEGDVLTIKGEKKVEDERKDDQHHVVERAYGRFARSMRLPFAAGESDVRAAFDKGVLTVTVPKPREVVEQTRRIEIQGG
jgi:HSP20 family protein